MVHQLVHKLKHVYLNVFYKVSKHDNSNGLGLAITKSIIELHHGTIQFTQSNEYVTTFTITLPNNSL